MLTQDELTKILFRIGDSIENTTEQMSNSLFSGKAGTVLFYGHLYECFGREIDYKHFSEGLQNCLEEMMECNTNHTLSNGYTGLLWVIQHFIRIGMIDDTITDNIGSINQHMIKSFEKDTHERNYDLLHGLVGKGLYFLECPWLRETYTAIEQIIDRLETIAVDTNGIISWADPACILEKGTYNYNLGMAHGVPSVLAFLAKAHEKGVDKKRTKVMIESSVSWLLQQELTQGHARYPTSTKNKAESRLAWCYGDLGPALAIYHASFALQRDDLREKAIEIALHAGKRNLQSSGVYYESTNDLCDVGFCHGTAGIAHIFNRFYQATKIEKFRFFSNYWLELSIEITPGSSKTQTYLFPDNTRKGAKWTTNHTLLEGLTGLGLMLLSHLRNEGGDWDGIFMTDIKRIPDTTQTDKKN